MYYNLSDKLISFILLEEIKINEVCVLRLMFYQYLRVLLI